MMSLVMASCKPCRNEQVDAVVTYNNGERDTVSFETDCIQEGDTRAYLNNSCLYKRQETAVKTGELYYTGCIVCGVRTFKIIDKSN